MLGRAAEGSLTLMWGTERSRAVSWNTVSGVVLLTGAGGGDGGGESVKYIGSPLAAAVSPLSCLNRASSFLRASTSPRSRSACSSCLS